MSRKRLTALVAAGVAAVLFVLWLCCLPRDLFPDCYSSCVLDRNGELLGARIAADGQWRFPPCDSVNRKYAAAVIEFEDRRFRYHPGVDPLAVGRALVQNIRNSRTVSGASTISMQLIRLSRGNRKRNLGEKVLECIMATRLELRYSKDEILALYASHAPFGGNVVGIDAASWRYFGHSSGELSWGEAATLAVLPNSPSSIHPGRNRDRLLAKRNALLLRLRDKGTISEEDYELACCEAVAEGTLELPELAAQYVERMCNSHPGERISSGIELHLQRQLEELCDRHCREFAAEGIEDLAAVIIDVHSGEVVARVGNSDRQRSRNGAMVDISASPRSSGSILKPLLYTAALQDGQILPNTLLKDTPVNIDGFKPRNFDRSYSGAVPASEALARSLNVPFVGLLRDYGVERFDELLRRCKLSSLKRRASDYGLSLILGGAEVRLDELCRAYADLALYYCLDDESIRNDAVLKERYRDFPFFDRTAVWHCLEALSTVNRPDEMDWRRISSVRKIAWKTGTSWGYRDAWAIGISPDYVVGVWAGNADGHSAPGISGARTAGPVMFGIFSLLPRGSSFPEPRYGDYVVAEVCRNSGMLKTPYCESYDSLMLPLNALRSRPCAYHKSDGSFVLPPAMDWYMRRRHPEAYSSGRRDTDGDMEFIYPENGSVLSVTRQMDGSRGGIVFRLAHKNPDAVIYWHLDQDYMGCTTLIHTMTLCPDAGRHVLTVTDQEGNSRSLDFTVQKGSSD